MTLCSGGRVHCNSDDMLRHNLLSMVPSISVVTELSLELLSIGWQARSFYLSVSLKRVEINAVLCRPVSPSWRSRQAAPTPRWVQHTPPFPYHLPRLLGPDICVKGDKTRQLQPWYLSSSPLSLLLSPLLYFSFKTWTMIDFLYCCFPSNMTHPPSLPLPPPHSHF